MDAVGSPHTEHYSIERLTDGVYFGRARPQGTALSNSGVVDLGGSTLIFDTSLTLRSAREIRELSRTLTGRAPTLSVNSHWHLDHVLGNQVFAEGPIYATRRSLELLLEKRADLEQELTREQLTADLRELEGQRAATGSEAGRRMYDATLRIHRALLQESTELRLTLPTNGFEHELRLPGGHDARLLTFGAGHTESDAMLFLASERILFAGDLVVAGTHPNLTSGDPEHWLTVLDRIEALRPERIVTGHGPCGSADLVGTMRDYLSTVIELARGSAEPELPERFRTFSETDQFADNVAYVRARRPSP